MASIMETEARVPKNRGMPGVHQDRAVDKTAYFGAHAPVVPGSCFGAGACAEADVVDAREVGFASVAGICGIVFAVPASSHAAASHDVLDALAGLEEAIGIL